MGSFAGITGKTDARIHITGDSEFAAGIEEIFRQGGMMTISNVQLHGKRIDLLAPIRYIDDRLVVYYNYFENDWWEDAGFNRKDGYVWSDKIGGKAFSSVILAAYYYEQLHYKGISVVDYNGRYYFGRDCIGWINQILNKDYLCKNLDPWPLFEFFHAKYPERCSTYDWGDYISRSLVGCIGYWEIDAVLKGSESFISKLQEPPCNINDKIKPDEITIFNYFFKAKHFVQKYKNESEATLDSQLEELIAVIRAYIIKNSPEIPEDINGELQMILLCLYGTGSPVFITKVISEVYEQDFWNLWKKVSDESEYRRCACGWKDSAEAPVSTEDFVGCTADDRIFWWTLDNPVHFSNGLWTWFTMLKEKYLEIRTRSYPDFSLDTIMSLLEQSGKNHRYLFAFESFFEESLEHLHDERYVALWELYRFLLLDIPFQKQSLDLMLPSEYKKKDDVKSLCFQKRVHEEIFRRFHALIANNALRKKIFGF